MSRGQPERVIRHAYALRKVLDLVPYASAIAGVQRGLQGIGEGTGEDAEDAFTSLERELGIVELM